MHQLWLMLLPLPWRSNSQVLLDQEATALQVPAVTTVVVGEALVGADDFTAQADGVFSGPFVLSGNNNSNIGTSTTNITTL